MIPRSILEDLMLFQKEVDALIRALRVEMKYLSGTMQSTANVLDRLEPVEKGIEPQGRLGRIIENQRRMSA